MKTWNSSRRVCLLWDLRCWRWFLARLFCFLFCSAHLSCELCLFWLLFVWFGVVSFFVCFVVGLGGLPLFVSFFPPL